jgi:hypothetical protein
MADLGELLHSVVEALDLIGSQLSTFSAVIPHFWLKENFRQAFF